MESGQEEIEEQTKSEVYRLENDISIKMDLKIKVKKVEEKAIEYNGIVTLECAEDKKIQLHWGVYKPNKPKDWVAPEQSLYPTNTKPCNGPAADTDFTKGKIEISFNILMTNVSFAGMAFVFHDLISNKWYNNGGANFSIQFIQEEKPKTPTGLIIPDCIQDVINCEGGDGSWCLMLRYNKCLGVLNQLNLNNSNEALWIYIWLRLSYKRLLDWQRKYNTQPKDLQWSMHQVTFEITKRFADQAKKKDSVDHFEISSAAYLEDALVMCGKGRGNGQLIRDEILNIMHRNGIKETNDHFYEQWHQKLHNNTTPDDVIICQALINYLKSNNMSDYHNTLKAGGITKERLCSYERKITCDPYFEPRYIRDFENFLNILKDVHSSTDLVVNFDQAKYALNNNGTFNEIIHFKDDWDTLKQIWRVTNGREELQKFIQGSLGDHGKLRDLLFFDSSLLIYLRNLVEKIIHIKLDFKEYVNEVTAIMKNITLTNNNYIEIQYIFEDWIAIAEKLKGDIDNSMTAMKIKSVTDRMSRLLGHITDYYNTVFEPRAKYFGYGCKIDAYFVDLFTEEEIRGSIFFALSVLIKKMEPILREKANLGPWKIISRGENNEDTGLVRYEKNLSTVQLEKFKERTILLCDQVGGNEEVPINCIGIIITNSSSYPDMLAHVSVRARNLKIPLIVCFDDKISDELKKFDKKNMKIRLVSQNLEYEQGSSSMTKDSNQSKDGEELKVQAVKVSDTFTNVFVEMKDFTKETVGAKSNNTLRVYGKLPDWIKYPQSFAVPFNVNEYFLSLDENKTVKDELDKINENIAKETKMATISSLLEKCKKLTMNIQIPKNNDYAVILIDRLIQFGITKDGIDSALASIKSVWASKYNERAYIATSKVGIPLLTIRMAVLCQKIISADYAFVIHTKNPSNNDANEVYCEVVFGMGETLVGSYEGQAFSFVYNKKTNQSTIKSYPNKSIALTNSGFIFRSDSNTEDLEGFAGAGLFDSVPMVKDNQVRMKYHTNELFNDAQFATEMMYKVGNLGIEVEKMYDGAPQDIEGVYSKGQYYIVQTRPQV